MNRMRVVLFFLSYFFILLLFNIINRGWYWGRLRRKIAAGGAPFNRGAKTKTGKKARSECLRKYTVRTRMETFSFFTFNEACLCASSGVWTSSLRVRNTFRTCRSDRAVLPYECANAWSSRFYHQTLVRKTNIRTDAPPYASSRAISNFPSISRT